MVPEPLGGAHRDHVTTACSLKDALLESLENLAGMAMDQLLEERYQRLMRYGTFSTSEPDGLWGIVTRE